MDRRTTTTLGSLSDEDLAFCPAWQVIEATDDGDQVLVPAPLIASGEVSRSVEEVWCRSVCRLPGGVELPACTLSIANSGEGPIAWSITHNGQEVRLILPPAPEFVLREEGPAAFAKRLQLALSQTFPLILEVSVRFEESPHNRSIRIDADGTITSLSE
jgi:hypothetical protein